MVRRGRLDIQEFLASSVVKSTETFAAASTGILDGDMTGPAYQTGKDAAFLFFGDLMGPGKTSYRERTTFNSTLEFIE